ncbi:unnamed protein product [Cyclocybe aegerita]|uniref:C3H1-type domain-containing protein n=1 Tax=Cyclocybe aegerita TaxID=1973307 RepID=A0A8S0VQR5_CYCAE|nr:unnamed protein product [Cyclocybe aegerita]
MEQSIQASVPPQVEERRAQRAARKAIGTEEGEKYSLAATYLKLEVYEPAAWAATIALEFDPRLVKARFRRGIARRNTFLYDGARKDFEAILRRDPDCQEAHQELEIVRGLLAATSEELEHESDDEEHPGFSDEAWESYSDSDSPDCKHLGIDQVAQPPCQAYNRGGCENGIGCPLGHAPDRKSVRDELGKNVCVYYLLGNCASGEASCPYSHDRNYLPPNGWWNYPDQVEAAKVIQPLVENRHTYKEVNKALRANPKARRFGARRHREEILENLQYSHSWVMEDARRVAAVDAIPQTTPPTERFVLLVSLEEDNFLNIHKHLMSTMKQRVRVVQVFNARQATTLLDSPHLVAVLATDAGIARRKYSALRNKIVGYVQNGGSILVAGSFSTHVSGTEFEKLTRAFGLPWTYGSYNRSLFSLNPVNEVASRNPSLVQSYSMKSLRVGNISPEQASLPQPA